MVCRWKSRLREPAAEALVGIVAAAPLVVAVAVVAVLAGTVAPVAVALPVETVDQKAR